MKMKTFHLNFEKFDMTNDFIVHESGENMVKVFKFILNKLLLAAKFVWE